MATPKIKTLPGPPDWSAARAAMDAGSGEDVAIRRVLHLPDDADTAAVIDALGQQPTPTISIYAQSFTAHVTGADGVPDGLVYAELRDHCAARAADDPAMREVKRRKLIELLDQWQVDGPPSAEDEKFWRTLDADLAKARVGGELERQLDEAHARIAALESEVADLRGRVLGE